MSVRAYRVEEIRTNGASFNLWHDVEVIRWLEKETSFFDRLNGDLCGLTTLGVDELERMLVEIGGRLNSKVRESLQDDIDHARAFGRDYVEYLCY